MHRLMLALSHFTRRFKWPIMVVWILLVAFSIAFARKADEHLVSGFSGSKGSQSKVVQESFDSGDFGSAGRPNVGVIVNPEEGSTPQQRVAAVDRVNKAASETKDVVPLSDADLQNAQQEAELQAQPFNIPLQINASQNEAVKVTQDLSDKLNPGDVEDGVVFYFVGQSALQAAQAQLASKSVDKASAAGFPAMLIVLLLVLGSLVAALLPLLLGFAAISVTLMAVFFLSQAVSMSVFVPSLAAMIGLGVGVDYSLFILLRYREDLNLGKDRSAAMAKALSTSAVAVTFSGLTVMLSLAGLFLMQNSTIRSMAFGAIIVVAVAVMGANTLLPSVISAIGRPVEQHGPFGRTLARIGSKRRGGGRGTDGSESIWERFARWATLRPALKISAVVLVLLVVSYPATKIDLDSSTVLQLPTDNQARIGSNKAAELAGPGSTAPTAVMVAFNQGTVNDSANQATLGEVKKTVEEGPGVAKTQGPQPSGNEASAVYSVTLDSDPESPQAKDDVKTMRSNLEHSSAAKSSIISVGGETASEIDFNDSISSTMWKIFLFIVILSYLLLTVLLRSMVLPLIGVLMNILCVTAAYGVLVAIFQWGWLPGLGFEKLGFVDAIIMPLLLAIVFGLSMDYQVFLLTRVREHHNSGESTREAALSATATSTRAIIGAATIMVAVFVMFIIFGVHTIQAASLGAAVAIGFSALVVQLVFMPSLITLLGDKVWWMPDWAKRILPEIKLE